MSFGEWLKGELRRAGYSQSRLAGEMGISSQAINQWLRPIKPTKPSPEHLHAIVKTLNIRLGDLPSDDIKLAAAVLAAVFEEFDPAERQALLFQADLLRSWQSRSR